MLQGLIDFAQSLGAALATLLQTLCYVSGTFMLLGSVWGNYKRSKGENGPANSPFVCAAMFFAGATFLSFPTFLNIGNQTLGFSGTAGLSSSATTVKFSASDLTAAVSQGPIATLTAILSIFRYYFMCYGAYWIYISVMRQIGSMKGRNNTSTSVNLCMIVGGFLVMNADTVAPALAKQLHLLSS